MKKILITSLLTSYMFGLECNGFKDFIEYNGHYYAITTSKLEFLEAKAGAENNNGYLVIPNNQAENDFIHDLVAGSSTWIGIYDPNYIQNYCYDSSSCYIDDSRFKTALGNSPVYKNWYDTEPNNLVKEYDTVDGKQMVSPLGENWVILNGNNGKWYDVGNHADEYNNPVKHLAVFEFETRPDCMVESDAVTDWTGLKCNTQIWDTTTGILENGTTLDCLEDSYGNDYCPSALAEATQEWDYEDGYSVEGVGTAVDYTDKVDKITNSSYEAGFKLLTSTTSCYRGCTSTTFEPVDYIDFITDIYHSDSDNTQSTTRTTHLRIHSDGRLEEMVSCTGRCWGGNYGVWYPIESKGFSFRTSSWSEETSSATIYDNGTIKSLSCGYASGGRCWSYTFEEVETLNLLYDFWNDGQDGTSRTSYKTAKISSGNCYDGGTLNGTNCTVATTIKVCPDGYVETTGSEMAKGECKRTIEYAYYEYMCLDDENSQGFDYVAVDSGGDTGKTDPDTTSINQSSLDDPLNSSTVPSNNCVREKFTCQYNEERPAVWVDNKWQCSPFPCYGQDDTENLDTNVTANDKDNDGWNEDGGCDGTIYIFNGKTETCRSWDMFFGLTGGGCCDKEKVFLGLIGCKAEEKKLAKVKIKKFTHYVGEFCSKKLDLGFTEICIQKKQSYCKFNSKLARIIHEQARPQIDLSWGVAKAPNCRGFTPLEFQKLDFSKIDLSEFTEDLESQMNTGVFNNLGTFVSDKVNNFFEN